jgi:hypothetical protein
MAVLRQRKADQAAEQLKAGDSWRGTKDSYVFTTGWAHRSIPIRHVADEQAHPR